MDKVNSTFWSGYNDIGFVLCFSEILEDWILDLDFLLDIGPL